MEIGQQIKKLRTHMAFSQDQLAMEIYVSRQTISSWENGKSYPDVKSLLLLSSLFKVSLDQLIKGDVEEMRQVIQAEDMEQFKKDGKVLSILFITMVCSCVPLFLIGKGIGIGVWLLITTITFYYAFRVEKHKIAYDVQTYKEILNFMDGKSISDLEKQCEIGKRPYQKLLLALGGALIAALVTGGLIVLIELFQK